MIDERLDPIGPGGALFEMAMTRERAIQRVTAMEAPLNEHLLKIMLLPSHRDIDHWKKEVRGYIRRIEKIRLKPETKPGDYSFYFDILFDEIYGDGLAMKAVASQADDIGRDYGVDLSGEDFSVIAYRLQGFHQSLADHLSRGETGIADKLLPTL